MGRSLPPQRLTAQEHGSRPSKLCLSRKVGPTRAPRRLSDNYRAQPQPADTCGMNKLKWLRDVPNQALLVVYIAVTAVVIPEVIYLTNGHHQPRLREVLIGGVISLVLYAAVVGYQEISREREHQRNHSHSDRRQQAN